MPRKPKNEKETTREVVVESAKEVVQEPIEEIVKKEEAVEKEYTVTCDGYLNVRKGPGTDYEIIKQLANEDTVTVLEFNGPWAKIGPDRWVMKEFLK